MLVPYKETKKLCNLFNWLLQLCLLVLNSLVDGHTNMHTDFVGKSNFKNQIYTDLWLACIWLKVKVEFIESKSL